MRPAAPAGESSAAVIRNCEFRFRCDRTWGSLQATADEAVRYCAQCRHTVHYCRTPVELQAALVENRCVAVELHGAVDATPEPTVMVGTVASHYVLK